LSKIIKEGEPWNLNGNEGSERKGLGLQIPDFINSVHPSVEYEDFPPRYSLKAHF